MSPTYTGLSKNVPEFGLDGKYRQVRTRTQANLQLCQLPVPPSIRSGPTDTGPVAEFTGQNTEIPCPPDLFGEGVHVPDRTVNSDRKTSSPRQVTHKAHSMASQEQLEDPGISREGDSSTQIFTPPLTMVAE